MKSLASNKNSVSAVYLFIALILTAACNIHEPETEKEKIEKLLKSRDWRITYLFNDSNQTERFKDFTLTFRNENVLKVANPDSAFSGEWTIHQLKDDNQLTLGFADSSVAIAGNWKIIDYTKSDFKFEDSDNDINIGTDKKMSLAMIVP